MTRTTRGWLRPAAVLGLTAALVAPLGGNAAAAIAHSRIVSANPANNTPHAVDDGTVANAAVYAYAQSGSTMYAGGRFRTVKNAARTATYTRYHLMAFDVATGVVSNFAPNFNGAVWAIVPSGGSLYVAGEFSTVNGVSARGLVKIDAATGAVDTSFRPALNATATDAKLVDGRLLVSGNFTKRLVALDPATGADTGYLNLGINGSIASNAGATRVYRFAVNPAATRLVAIGNFTSVSGQSRRQAFMVNLGTSGGTLSPWYYSGLDLLCAADTLPVYLRDVDFSPDGSYFAFASTGFVPRKRSDIGKALCDAAARFETTDSPSATPTWINYTGGDTLHSVLITGATVYVGGHQRWLDNPYGRDSAGPGAVSREGIGSIDPVTGKATAWNPGKTRGIGAQELYATPAGLWVGSDGGYFAGEYHDSIAFCPL